MLDVFGVMPGTLTTGVELMKQEHLLTVSPGKHFIICMSYQELVLIC